MKRVYNITAEEYDLVLATQEGVCAICKNPPKAKRLAVDHDHKTGLTRGLLCWACNSFLGKIKDDPEIADNAANYLRHPPVTETLGEERFGTIGSVRKRRRKRKKNG